ncbi:MAG: shikimate kinase [Clostridia bacterium]|nr:shikimate kinase [Clostridia bacterium]
MNLILCGMMGAGKTTIGIKIAEVSGRRWYDTDGIIVDRYGKISDIFEYYGENYFRKIETEIVKELASRDRLVISTGGGLVLKEENTALLKKNGLIVFLRASFETLVKRLKVDGTRPLLQSNTESIRERLVRLLEERTPIYQSVADLIVDVDGKTPEELAREIYGWYTEIDRCKGAGAQ